jgi:hypothetical protein
VDVDERLRLDYDQTTQVLRTLTDVRFKLLAFVPHGLALVCSVAVAGCGYLAGWGGLGALDFSEARTAGAVIGVACGAAVLVEVERIRRRSDS